MATKKAVASGKFPEMRIIKKCNGTSMILMSVDYTMPASVPVKGGLVRTEDGSMWGVVDIVHSATKQGVCVDVIVSAVSGAYDNLPPVEPYKPNRTAPKKKAAAKKKPKDVASMESAG